MSRSYYKVLWVVLAVAFAANFALADQQNQTSSVSTLTATVPAPAVPSIVAAVPAVSAVTAALDAAYDDAAHAAAKVDLGFDAGHPVAFGRDAALEVATAPPDVVANGVNAIQATKNAISGRNIAGWLTAFSAILWFGIVSARRFGWLKSRRAVAITTLVAAVVGGISSQMVLGVSATEAVVIALGGPGAIALHEVLRAFGFNASPSPTLVAAAPENKVDRESGA